MIDAQAGRIADLEAAQPECQPLTVLAPIKDLENAIESLGKFCSDQGWGASDMQSMDNLIAIVEQHKAAQSKRQPLADDQVKEVWRSVKDTGRDMHDAISFARAIEAAHGIKGKP